MVRQVCSAPFGEVFGVYSTDIGVANVELILLYMQLYIVSIHHGKSDGHGDLNTTFDYYMYHVYPH